MNRPHEIFTGPLCLAALAAAFCLWSALGNEVNLCVTAGCSLYHDATVGGLSLWWLGCGVFAALGILALVGAAPLGRLLAGLALLGETALLLLMALTAPCISCLVVAVFFALLYMSFLKAGAARARAGKQGFSVLLTAWALLFLVNLGTVARSQADVWPIADSAGTTVRMFFSPSCPSCREGIAALSGHVDVAFYPLAENDADVYKVAHMLGLLNSGASMAEALTKVQDVVSPGGLSALGPDMLLLRFRMLRNKAHVFGAGVQTVPFFEYHGLPSMLVKQGKAQQSQRAPVPATAPAWGADNADLPLEPQIAGQCSGALPCP